MYWQASIFLLSTTNYLVPIIITPVLPELQPSDERPVWAVICDMLNSDPPSRITYPPEPALIPSPPLASIRGSMTKSLLSNEL